MKKGKQGALCSGVTRTMPPSREVIASGGPGLSLNPYWTHSRAEVAGISMTSFARGCLSDSSFALGNKQESLGPIAPSCFAQLQSPSARPPDSTTALSQLCAKLQPSNQECETHRVDGISWLRQSKAATNSCASLLDSPCRLLDKETVELSDDQASTLVFSQP